MTPGGRKKEKAGNENTYTQNRDREREEEGGRESHACLLISN